MEEGKFFLLKTLLLQLYKVEYFFIIKYCIFFFIYFTNQSCIFYYFCEKLLLLAFHFISTFRFQRIHVSHSVKLYLYSRNSPTELLNYNFYRTLHVYLMVIKMKSLQPGPYWVSELETQLVDYLLIAKTEEMVKE